VTANVPRLLPVDPGLRIRCEHHEEIFRQSVYDVRTILTEVCDVGSWGETAPDWGRGTVGARARMRGLPIGIVATQCMPVTQVSSIADAANRNGTRHVLRTEPANVWTSTSAAKTAATLEQMRLEGLPVLLVANYRGFSGGATDMFDRVLEYGAQIVDTLTKDGPPVWVYVPPHGQLRGGAFVVVSPSINPGRVQMYLAPTSRVGVLEPEAQAKFMWKTTDAINPIGTMLALSQDVPERLLHHKIVSGVVSWPDWIVCLQNALCTHYGVDKRGK
jgi:acetyl-CoA carboxylase carboxyltransferase component